MQLRLHGFLLLLTISHVVAGCSVMELDARDSRQSQPAGKADNLWSPPRPTYNDRYLDQIQPILDRRCVTCHSCYNAPCQLKLSSYEGLARGASKKRVYDNSRLMSVEPTRLFIDAKTPEQWHTQKGFFPVVHHAADNAAANIESSLMYKMLTSGQAHKSENPYDDFIPTSFTGVAEESRNCPKDAGEFETYIQQNPDRGMPFGCPEIDTQDYETIVEWIKQGAPGPSPQAQAQLESPSTGAMGRMVLEQWEDFFNKTSPKERLTARYLYEHLFLAHLYFDEIPGDYYRLVRSRTARPAPVDEVNTVRPYDDPGGPFVYRLSKITSTIVHKTHIIYHLSDARMKRFQELFWDSDWGDEPVVLPDYARGANPFVTFARIPARARYTFLLDDVHYTIMSFIRGPVCRGQTALNVIRDHFYVLLIDPDSDVSVIDPALLEQTAELLEMPIRGKSNPLLNAYTYYKNLQKQYVGIRDDFYAQHYPDGMALTDIWDGDGDKTALLTIYRHFDSGSVLRGAVGGIPKTVMLLDYPILERIYYDLVAGFNVFGNITHQMSVREYMDDLRVESEDNFLRLLPPKLRTSLREEWNQGLAATVDMTLNNPFWGGDRGTRIAFTEGKDPVLDLLEQVFFDRLTLMSRGEMDPINGFGQPAFYELDPPAEAITTQKELDEALQSITVRYGEFIQLLPEVSFIRVTRPGGADLAYTLLHNRDHLNVSTIFMEETYLNPEKDTLHVVKGFVGSHPNFFFVVPMDRAAAFINDILGLRRDDGSFGELVARYGIRRANPALWTTLDWFHKVFFYSQPRAAGIFDLNRYQSY